MISGAAFIIGILIIAFGQWWALRNFYDNDYPLTHWIRKFFWSFGVVGGTVLMMAVLIWLGCHFIFDVTGSLSC